MSCPCTTCQTVEELRAPQSVADMFADTQALCDEMILPDSGTLGPIKVEYSLCDSTEVADSLPSQVDYPGNYGFSVRLTPPCGRPSYCYSELLDQVFIDMNRILAVEVDVNPLNPELFVRALPVYASPEHTPTPVSRCPLHSVDVDPLGKAHEDGSCECALYQNVGHVVRCMSTDAIYSWEPTTGRHSVLCPVRPLQPGASSFGLAYYFACKTSCRKGMQRRPINLIFTLETLYGEVVGRKVLGVRICTCPKRDMERLEEGARRGAASGGGRRRGGGGGGPPPLRRTSRWGVGAADRRVTAAAAAAGGGGGSPSATRRRRGRPPAPAPSKLSPAQRVFLSNQIAGFVESFTLEVSSLRRLLDGLEERIQELSHFAEFL